MFFIFIIFSDLGWIVEKIFNSVIITVPLKMEIGL